MAKTPATASRRATKTSRPAPKTATPGKVAKAGKARKSAKAVKAAAPVAKRDVPAPVKGKGGKPKVAKPIVTLARRDSLDPEGSVAAKLLKQMRKEVFEFHRAESKAKFDESAFYEFFGAEIDAELNKVATIFNDRYARWPCQCCDAIIPVPRRTTVFHGDYVLEHDDVMGLLVNGERWIPKADTPIEVVQPGRLRNPWSGRVIEGRDLGTTGIHS